jgi:hypothetical protein
MFKTVTIAALTAAILATGVSTASAAIVPNGNTLNGKELNGGGENGNTLNGGGENGRSHQGASLNGGGDNSRSAQGIKINGRIISNHRSVQGVEAAGAVSTGVVVLAVELPPAQ